MRYWLYFATCTLCCFCCCAYDFAIVCLLVCLHAPNENQIDYLSYCLLVAFALLFVFDSLFLLSDSKKSINNSSETNIDD